MQFKKTKSPDPGTCQSADGISQTQDQKQCTNSEVAADWHA